MKLTRLYIQIWILKTRIAWIKLLQNAGKRS